MSFSFIHVSDIHLGRPFSDLSGYCSDDRIKSYFKTAVGKAFNNFVNFAIDKNVDFILISGDTFDSNEQDFESKLILKTGLKKLENAGIKVFLICGNHDCLNSYNKITFDFNENSNIKIVGLNSDIFSKFIVNDKSGNEAAVIHTLSFKDNVFSENPVKYFNQPDAKEKELFNIGLLHCDLNASKDSPYAPCKYSDLEALNYNYWALGHIHIPSITDEKIQYCGTVQGRNTKETGAHGFKYIQVSDGKIVENSFIAADIVRYEDLDIDISHAKDSTQAASIINETILNKLNNAGNESCELFFVRVNLTGFVSFYNEINNDFIESITEYVKEESAFKVYISRVENNTQSIADIDAISADDGIANELYKKINDDDFINSTYNSLTKSISKFIDDCHFTNEESLKFKEETISQAKQTCINLCGLICTNEED